MPDAAPAPSSPNAEPVVIDGLFGWFDPGASRRGVILCGATGFEQLSAHRAWGELAGRIAGAGCATLRFDYPGEGDSSDDGAGSLQAWLGAIRRAVRFLREEAGAEEVVLVGLRLGATLAVLAARDCAVDRLVLLAPFRTGQGYLREMKFRALAVNALPDGTVPAETAGHLSVGGFPIAPALAADLAAIDIGSVPAAPAARILLLGPEVGPLADRYAALGAAVARGPLAGLGLLVGNPLFAVAPEEAFARVVAFAAENAPPRTTRARSVAAPARLADADWTEEAARFGPGLFGVLASPTVRTPGAPALLFVAAGLTVHSGWGRQITRMARLFAAEGVPSLRVDLRGIGDGADRPGRSSPLFAADTRDDLRHALDHLAARAAGPVVIVGSCSGAYAAFHGACHDPRIAAALLVNPPCFDRHPDDVDFMIRATFGSTATYAAMLRSGRTWRRLLTGAVGVRAIGAALAERGLRAARRRVTDLLRPRPGGSLARRIAALRRRGAVLRLVYSADDPGLAVLRAHIGRTPERAARRLGAPVAIVPHADHNLSPPHAQAALAGSLRDLLADLKASRVPRVEPRRAARFYPVMVRPAIRALVSMSMVIVI